jgi:hypothetical protein
MNDRKAATVDSNARGIRKSWCDSRRMNRDFASGAARFEALDCSQMLDDAGEHCVRSVPAKKIADLCQQTKSAAGAESAPCD